MIGHVGDGNFHIFTGVDPTKPAELDDIRLLADKVAAKSLELGGTCTGEHGVGLGEFLVSKRNRKSQMTKSQNRLNHAHIINNTGPDPT